MAIVAGEIHDVFISYAHDDDTHADGLEWIDQLASHLKNRLSALTGNESSVWRDRSLRGNSPILAELSNRLERSGVLLAIVSPAYERSKWCRWELSEFLRLHQLNGTSDCLHSRVARADKLPPNSSLLGSLAGAPAFCFYETDADGRYPLELGPSQVSYQTCLGALASHIASVLEKLKEENGEHRKWQVRAN